MAKRVGKKLNLAKLSVDIQDTTADSEYFGIKDFDPVLTGGKNAISLAGSDILKPGSDILVEVLDTNGNPLYIEVGKGKGSVKFRDGVSIVIAIHVQSFVPIGNGKIYIVGTTKDNESVRWSKDITIDSSKQNRTKIRFYKTPTVEVEPFISDLSIFSNSQTIVASGSVNSIAVSPQKDTNFLKFDSLRNKVEYRVVKKSGNPFLSRMNNETITLTNITLTDGTVLPVTHSAKIKEVLNENEILLKNPFVYPNTIDKKIVKTFTSANFNISYTPVLPTSIAISSGFVFKKSLARITLNNLKTFTGNVYRFKVYRKSFNSNVDSEIIADSILDSRELLVDEVTSDRQREFIGFTFDQDQIDEYWHKNGLTSLDYDSSNIIDGMRFNGSVGANADKSIYVIAKDNTDPFTDETYVPVDPAQMNVRSGSAWDSNFIDLKKDVQYVITGRVYDSRSNSNEESRLLFYLTGSDLSYTTTNQFDGYGVNLGKVTFKPNVRNTFQDFTFEFSLLEDVNCTLVMIPQNGNFTTSNLSLKPLQEFSFSPEITTVRVPFEVSVANERFLVRAELFDVDHKNVPVVLEDIKFFDPSGETLAKSGSISSDWADISGKPTWINNFPNFSGFTITADVFNGTVDASDISGIVSKANTANTATSSLSANTATTAISATSAVSADTASYIKTSTVSSDPGTNHSIGTHYFDTSINAPIWYRGAGNWIDATGSVIYT